MIKQTFARLAVASAVAVGASSALAADHKIAVFGALTGVASFFGIPVTEGIKFGLDEINAKGLLGGGDKIAYEVIDTASARPQAMAAVTRVAADPNLLMILGPGTAVEAIPAAGVANELKIPMKALTVAVGVLKAGPWSFISPQPPQITMPQLGDYAIDVAKVKSCATIRFSDNEAYVDMERIFVEHSEKRGMKFVDRSGIKVADSDFSVVATRIVSVKPDCVLFFTLGPSAANLIIQLKQAGLPAGTKLIGQTGLSSPKLIEIGGAAVEGVVFNSDWVPGGTNPAGKAFSEAFKAKTGKEADSFAALGYSYVQVVAAAIRAASPNPTREKIRDALTKTKDVPVVVGNGKYSYVDRFPTYGSAFLQVKDGKFVLAPQ